MRKTALITGASHGIGFSIAKALASEFENLILVARSKKNLEKAASQLNKSSVTIFTADLEEGTDVVKLAHKLSNKLKSLDVLVNNAGIYIGKRFEKTSIAEINQMVNLNFRAYSLLTHQLLPVLRKGDNPQIINISSCASHTTLFGETMYSATKAAVTTFSNVLRQEVNAQGIRVTSVEPWGVDTYDTPQANYLLDPDEVGNLVNYIVNTPPAMQIDTVELSHIRQWRGNKPSWIE